MPDLAEMLAQADNLLAENRAMWRQCQGSLRSLDDQRLKLQTLREELVAALAEVPQTEPNQEWR